MNKEVVRRALGRWSGSTKKILSVVRWTPLEAVVDYGEGKAPWLVHFNLYPPCAHSEYAYVLAADIQPLTDLELIVLMVKAKDE